MGDVKSGATAEHQRLDEERSRVVRWKSWGPYLSERAWGTVREDYSADGNAWGYLPHDLARSRAYRWSEDGLAGVCDKNQTLCLALALWNEQDPILKERLFGLGGPEGNHGEDVKEVYYYEDATPTSSYLRYLYRYPQRSFPYAALVEGNARRGTADRELELWDLGAFEGDRFFDVTVEYAKRAPGDLLMVVTAENHGPEPAPLHLLPQLWFRNTWSWRGGEAPEIRAVGTKPLGARAVHRELGDYFLYVDGPAELLFTHNESNNERLFGVPSRTAYVKDAFHRRVVHGEHGAVSPHHAGTKAAAWRRVIVPARDSVRMVVRLAPEPLARPFDGSDEVLRLRRREADEYYADIQGPTMSEDRRRIQRQASAGLLWTMQYYQYDVETWFAGDATPPPESRRRGRNAEWRHLQVADIVSMPDKWEYPWFAAWDLAFHTLAMSAIDIDLAKAQLKLMVKEWYQHPNGQIPAYEWEFSDLNPPVHAWATYQIYKIERRQRGVGDRNFLERIFHKLLINFAWWVNKRDQEGNNVFEGGFLGLDNISIIDRSEQLPSGMSLEQSDATAWMAMYCLDLMRIALELAQENSAYEDLASKFFEHFLRIAWALNHGDKGMLGPWNEDSGFYFDIWNEHGSQRHLPVRSLVGLLPLCAVHVITAGTFRRLDNFRRRFEWYLARNPHLRESVTERDGRQVLSAVPPGRLERVLGHMFDGEKLMSPYGTRSLSKEHQAHPVSVRIGGKALGISYEPGEALTRMKGGNSNWRGPVWMPTAYLLYRSLQRLDHGFGDVLRIPGDGPRTIRDAASLLADRLIAIFERGANGQRPVFGNNVLFQRHPAFKDRLLFYEYFHGDTGEGLGASHQTGWSALVGDLCLRQARAADHEPESTWVRR
jgi:mannosylglycerate hydrolase MGH1-like protein